MDLHLNENYEEALKKLEHTIMTFPLTDADLPFIPPVEIGLSYDLFMRVDEILRKRNLFFWSAFGIKILRP